MNFLTISQYFNKLQILFFVLLILPLLVFITLYVFVDKNSVVRFEYYILIPSLALIEWMMAIIFFNKKIKSARAEQGLGAKLDKYFYITIVRYSFLAASGLILAIGYFLTRSDMFTIMYLASLLFSFLYWPTGPRVAAELMLRGDEREMVYFKKDSF